MMKISAGHYRHLAVSGLCFDVFRHEAREYNERTRNFRNANDWGWRAGDATNRGYGTKAEAEESARRYLASR